MRRLIAVMALALVCPACMGEVLPVPGPEGAVGEAPEELGEFGAGSIGGSDFGGLNLGGGLNLSGPGLGSSGDDPARLAQCLRLAGASMPAKEAFCNSLPDNDMRGRCWKNRYSRVGWTGWCFFEFQD